MRFQLRVKQIKITGVEVQEQSAANLVVALAAQAPYSSRLSARSALYTELCLLIDGHAEPSSRAEYRRLVVDRNCLARTSTAARNKLWDELRARYILDSRHPLYSAFWPEWVASRSEQERGLTAYTLFALHDRLVADLGVQYLFPLLRGAPAELRMTDVRAFLDQSETAHPEVSRWSEQTKRAVVRKYAASIRDFGLATGTVKKTTVRPALYGAPVRLVIKALRLAEFTPLRVLRAPIFRLLGIDETEVVDALGELNRLGELRFRMQGDVIELDISRRA